MTNINFTKMIIKKIKKIFDDLTLLKRRRTEFFFTHIHTDDYTIQTTATDTRVKIGQLTIPPHTFAIITFACTNHTAGDTHIWVDIENVTTQATFSKLNTVSQVILVCLNPHDTEIVSDVLVATTDSFGTLADASMYVTGIKIIN